MQGYPKSLNTWADVEYVVANFPREQWEADIKNLINDENVNIWVPVGDPLAEGDEGVTDDTHKVVADKQIADDPDPETGAMKTVRMQYEKQPHITCMLGRMKFCETEEDLNNAIEAVKAILG